VFSYLQNKESVTVLFNEVADRIAGRPGGYTRILKTGNRLGDSAELCIIELVDYNDAMIKEAKPSRARTRRSRRGVKAKAEETSAAPAGKAPEKEVVEQKEESPGDESAEEKENNEDTKKSE
jgi:large subunit ribosomal protein L17